MEFDAGQMKVLDIDSTDFPDNPGFSFADTALNEAFLVKTFKQHQSLTTGRPGNGVAAVLLCPLRGPHVQPVSISSTMLRRTSAPKASYLGIRSVKHHQPEVYHLIKLEDQTEAIDRGH